MADLSPMEWLEELGEELKARRGRVDKWQRYYDGDQDIPNGPKQHRDAYRQFQKKARTNLCRLAVDSVVHRMSVIGYKAGDDDRDNEIWKQIWQPARLDSRQATLYRGSLMHGAGYVIGGRNPRQPDAPLFTIESAKNVALAVDPADRTHRLAAVRVWFDRYERRWMATVYLPGQRIPLQARTTRRVEPGQPDPSIDEVTFKNAQWEQRAEPAESFERVPVIEFANATDGGEPRAEFDVAIDVQDRLNLTLLNRLTAERYAAFRQRFLMNYEAEYDEETGLPLQPFNPGADQTFVVPPPQPGVPEPRFGDLQQTDTANMLRAVEADMRTFAAVTITPVYYLPGDLINVSAEGVAALDAGHIAKIGEKSLSWSEDWEEVLALGAEIAGVDARLDAAEVVWARPENFDLVSQGDYASKMRTAGYPVTVIAEKLGESPQQVERIRKEARTEALNMAIAGAATGQSAGGGQRPSQGQRQAQQGSQ